MSNQIKSLLEQGTKGLLTEETLKEIETAFTTAVTEKAKIDVEAATTQLDNDHSQKLKRLVEAIDKDYTAKLIRVTQAIDKNHASKLRMVIERYEATNTQDAVKFKKKLVGTLSKYLDKYLDAAIPMQSIKEATANKRAELLLSDVKRMLAVDTALATESIREAVLDGKQTIDELQKLTKQLSASNKILTEKADNATAELLIEKKIGTLPEEKRSYMKRMMSGKTPQYITENFEYVLELHAKTESKTEEILREEASASAHGATVTVPAVAAAEKKAANQNTTAEDPIVENYMTELRKY